MADGNTTVAWKTVVTIGGAGGALAARKVVEAGWRAATGRRAPAHPDSPDTTWPQALAWAVASGAAIGVARLLVTRAAAHQWVKATGALPPGLSDA